MQTISSKELISSKDKSVLVLDIREKSSYSDWHIQNSQNIDVYNDVISYYYWEGDTTFGVEIYNERIAQFHKQMHDLTWKIAKPMPHFDWAKEWK